MKIEEELVRRRYKKRVETGRRDIKKETNRYAVQAKEDKSKIWPNGKSFLKLLKVTKVLKL